MKQTRWYITMISLWYYDITILWYHYDISLWCIFKVQFQFTLKYDSSTTATATTENQRVVVRYFANCCHFCHWCCYCFCRHRLWGCIHFDNATQWRVSGCGRIIIIFLSLLSGTEGGMYVNRSVSGSLRPGCGCQKQGSGSQKPESGYQKPESTI